MRPSAPLAIISALLLCCAGSCPRANSQTKTAQKSIDATVSGKVTIKGKPAPGVVVGLRSSQPAQFDPTFKATTDQDGKYRVSDVPTGSYEVAPVAPAFVISDVNNPRGQTVIITESENVEGIDFELVRGGVITGKVTDADGNPVVVEHVNVLPVDQRNQRGRDPFSLGFQTDDRGIYRVFGVPPGHYKVSIGQGDNGFNGRGRPAYPTTFYPDATDSSKATVIEIDEGTEATKIDITVSRRAEQVFSVKGRVVDEGGKPVANVGIELSRIIITDANSSSSFGGGTSARSDRQGEFRVEKLPAGKYSISIDPPPESDLRADPVTFDVLDQDVTGLLIKTFVGASLSGVVVIEGARDNSVMAALAQSYISAYIRNENFSSSQSARVKPDGSFRIGGLREGIANFSLYIPGKRLTISRTERDGVVQSNGIQIQNAEQVAGIRVIVAYHNGSIRGVVKLENGTLPPDGRLIIQLATTTGDSLPTVAEPAAVDSRGHFLIEGLATGNYELTIMAYAPGGRQRPPAAKQAVSVTDGAATDVIVTIDLTPTPNP